MAYGRKTGGRAKGTPNTATRTVREQLTQVFELLQQDKAANLLSWAKSNPTEFYKLAAKLIPLQVHTESEQPSILFQFSTDPTCHPIT